MIQQSILNGSGHFIQTINEARNEKTHITSFTKPKKQKIYVKEYKYVPIIFITIIHSLALYTTYLLLTFQLPLKWYIVSHIMAMPTALGTTAGVHRLWSHRTYSAKLPLRIFLMICQCATMQNNIFEWVRDHRVHHKFSDTDADPHNATRGFFFSHCGWLCCKKHPDVINKGKQVDMSDVLADPVVKFQLKYFFPLVITTGLIFPIALHMYLFKCSLWQAFLFRMLTYAVTLNSTWSVNSAAHIWGMRPYDKRLMPAENKIVAWFAMGEGWHNYHHVFPWDYKTGELGSYSLNYTTAFLDLMAKLGLAYNLKSASREMISDRMLRTGDGSTASGEKKRQR